MCKYGLVSVLTHEQLEMHGCILCTVAIDALMLKPQVFISTVLTKYSLQWTNFMQIYLIDNEQQQKISFWKNMSQMFKG